MATNDDIRISLLNPGSELTGDEYLPMTQYISDIPTTVYTTPQKILEYIIANFPTPKNIIPIGGIIQYKGPLSNFDDVGFGKVDTEWETFVLCNGVRLRDGSDTVPNLVDKFIVGSGGTYKIGDTGGESRHTLTVNELPAHAHTYDKTSYARHAASRDGNGVEGMASPAPTQSSSIGGNQPFNLLPPYYALAYIMRYK